MKEKLAKKVRQLLPHILSNKLPKEVAVVEIAPKTSRYFNQRYRKENKIANVLSFYYSPDYGEILVCPEVVRREAKKQGHTYKYQMTWMIIHGMIHLAGIHHEGSQKSVKQAERLESLILDGLAGKRSSKFKVQSSK